MYDLSRRLPAIEELRDRCRAMAVLDAILSPDWEFRHYSFTSRWADGEEMASMRDGSGSDWFIVFGPAGVYGRGFDHRAPNAPQVLDVVPEAFRAQVTEPAFAGYDGEPVATICFWREHAATRWSASVAEEGGRELFDLLLAGTPEAYGQWAADYYETTVSLSAVRHVYAQRPMTTEVLAELDSDRELDDLLADLDEIGYPR